MGRVLLQCSWNKTLAAKLTVLAAKLAAVNIVLALAAKLTALVSH